MKTVIAPKTFQDIHFDDSFYNMATAIKVFEANKAKGFWPGNPIERDLFQISALICSELFESYEALRKGKRADKHMVMQIGDLSADTGRRLFEQNIKDTVEDEIADTVIRCLDAIGAAMTVHIEHSNPRTDLRSFNDENLLHVLHDTQLQRVVEVSDQVNWYDRFILKTTCSVYHFLAAFVEENRSTEDMVDEWATFSARCAFLISDLIGVAYVLGFHDTLTEHIKLKLAFNASRPHKHGKSF